MVTRREATYLAAFAVAAVYFLIWPLWRAQFPLEIWPTESWNAYFQDTAAQWKSVYPSAGQLISNNYPPLSFYTVGALSHLFGDALYVGRALSFVALFAVAVEIAAAVVLLGGTRLFGALGGLWFVASMAHLSLSYVGADDPQLTGLAIMGAGLVWFLARERDGQSCLPALLLMVCAGFWKHNIIAIPLTAVLWLACTRTWRAIDTIAASIVAAALGLAACGLLFGPDFFSNLLAPRSYSLWLVIPHLGHLQWQGIAYLVWALWFLSAKQTYAARFTRLHIGVALLTCVLQWIGDGVAQNAEFDLMLSLGIGVGLALSHAQAMWLARKWGTDRTRDAIVVLLLLRLLASTRQEPARVLFSPNFRAAFAVASQIVARDVARVAALPGEVYCDNKTICRFAGKPFVVDEFVLEQMIATGAATKPQIADMLRARGITSFVTAPMASEYVVTQAALNAKASD